MLESDLFDPLLPQLQVLAHFHLQLHRRFQALFPDRRHLGLGEPWPLNVMLPIFKEKD